MLKTGSYERYPICWDMPDAVSISCLANESTVVAVNCVESPEMLIPPTGKPSEPNIGAPIPVACITNVFSQNA